VAVFSWRRNQRWLALVLTPVLLAAAMLSPCGTCCAVEKAVHQAKKSERPCCQRQVAQLQHAEDFIAAGLHSCCQTSHDPASHQHKEGGCDCCIGSRTAWVVPKVIERDHAAHIEFVVAAIIDWSASADLASGTHLSFRPPLDEAPPPAIPQRILFCRWLI